MTKLIYGGIVSLLVAVLTVGAVSAMSGGSHQTDSSAAPSQESATPTPSGDEAGDAESDDADAADTGDGAQDTDIETDDATADAANDPAGNEKIAQAIADEFGTTPDAVLALHDQGIGFGALFKLYSIARAKGITIDELLAQIDASGGGFAFGKLKKSLTDEQLAILEDGPKNLGALVSQANKNGDEDSSAVTADGSDSPDGASSAHGKAKGHAKTD